MFSIYIFRISHFATADEFTDTTIRIITIEKRQYGDYICKASNVLGTAETTVNLYGKYNKFILLIIYSFIVHKVKSV